MVVWLTRGQGQNCSYPPDKARVTASLGQDPFRFFVKRQTGLERKGIPEWFDGAEEVQNPLIKSVFQEFGKDAAEQAEAYS